MNFYLKTFFDVIVVTIPVFFIVAIGYVFRRREIIKESAVPSLNKTAYYLGLTTLVFTSLIKYDLKDIINAGIVKTIYSTFAIFIVIVVLSVIFLKIKGKAKGALAISSFRCNMAFIGLPVVVAAFGGVASAKTSVIIGLMTPLNIIVSIIFLKIFSSDGGKKGYGKMFISFVKDPLLIAAILGILFSYFEIKLPKPVMDILDILSGLAIPLALITIGASFRFKHIKKHLKLVAAASFLKLIVEPLIAFAIGVFVFKLSGLDVSIIVLLLGMPLAVAAYIMGKQYDSDSDFISSALIVSTMVSAVTITLWLFFLKVFFKMP